MMALFVEAMATSSVIRPILRLTHLFCFASTFGMSLWVSFVSGAILSQCTSTREQYGYLQSRIFPLYFRIAAFGEAILLATHAVLHPWSSAGTSEQWQFQILFCSLFMTVLNVYILEPLSTKVMFERLKMEKEEGISREDILASGDLTNLDYLTKCQMRAVNSKLSRVQDFSSMANLVSLGCLTWHLLHLQSHLGVR
ncbi:hypothetical protein O6H91_19G018900 [Diphasiastrum complanatum]|uniref:Uncharacterized protein n=1 Tax=Diphasiastrum complanatum TaxID=34168 RepID=A0ACC2ATB0_DIPCM|nr:hypothetical protein O6H91_19G018900 [Diphasiastrum complanatum]